MPPFPEPGQARNWTEDNQISRNILHSFSFLWFVGEAALPAPNVRPQTHAEPLVPPLVGPRLNQNGPPADGDAGGEGTVDRLATLLAQPPPLFNEVPLLQVPNLEFVNAVLQEKILLRCSREVNCGPAIIRNSSGVFYMKISNVHQSILTEVRVHPQRGT